MKLFPSKIALSNKLNPHDTELQMTAIVQAVDCTLLHQIMTGSHWPVSCCGIHRYSL